MLLPPWVLMRGWETFQTLESDDPGALRRLLRQSQHFLSPDGKRFAPVRLLRELGSGLAYPVDQKDPVSFSRLEPELSSQGWRTLRGGEPHFTEAFDAWAAYCLSFGADNGPRNWDGADPKTGRTFTVPAKY